MDAISGVQAGHAAESVKAAKATEKAQADANSQPAQALKLVPDTAEISQAAKNLASSEQES